MSQHKATWVTVVCARPACVETVTLRESQLNGAGTKYCSRECYGTHKSEQAEYVKLACSHCGSKFEKLKSQARAKKYGYFCSRKCQSAHKEMHVGKAKKLRSGKYVTCAHPGCMETFYRKRCHLAKGHKNYCEKHWKHRKLGPETRAKISQASIDRDSVSHLKKVWADPEFRKAFGESRRGENHPCWNGGSSYKDYDPEFMSTIRYSTKHRDGYCCQLCHVQKRRSELHSHHIDHDKDNSDPMNIVTLCRRCHGKVHRQAVRDAWQSVFQHLMLVAA